MYYVYTASSELCISFQWFNDSNSTMQKVQIIKLIITFFTVGVGSTASRLALRPTHPPIQWVP